MPGEAAWDLRRGRGQRSPRWEGRGWPYPAGCGQPRRTPGLVWAHAGWAEGRQKGSSGVEGAGVMANWMCHGTSLQMQLPREVSSTRSQPPPWVL